MTRELLRQILSQVALAWRKPEPETISDEQIEYELNGPWPKEKEDGD